MRKSIKKTLPEIKDIDIPDLTNTNKRGAYGDLFRGTYQFLPVAVKILAVSRVSIEEDFEQEAEILFRLNHPNIVRFYGILQGYQAGLVFEFVEQGSLYDIYKSKQDSGWDLLLRLRMAKEIGMALHYLHKQAPPIWHRDLKSQNILIDSDCHAKLCDFGSSKRQKDINRQQSVVGTIPYMAPEMFMLEKGQCYTEAVDLFSYGLVIWGLLHSKEPGAGPQKIPLQIKRLNPNLDAGEDIDVTKTPQELIGLLRDSWHRDPGRRPSAKQFVDALSALLEKSLLRSAQVQAQPEPQPQPKPQPQPANYREQGVEKEAQHQPYDALCLYQKAIETGDKIACTNLGTQLLKGIQDPRQAHRFFKIAAQEKHPRGMYNLAYSYEKGLGTRDQKPKLEKAKHWYQMAADAGHEQAGSKIRSLTMQN